MTKALKPGDDRGVSILIGGKRTLKVGDLMGIMIVPFMKLETEEDYEKLLEFAGKILEFFAENALEHERIGETMDRIGLPAFLEAVGVDPDPNMVKHPRTSSYVRTDDFTEEAEKYFARKKFDRAAKMAKGNSEAAE
jgi:sulfite reductase alpha subunit